MTARIRALGHDDIAALQAIDRAAHGEAWSTAAFVDQIDRPNFTHLVATIDGDPAAHAASWRDGAELRIINVAADPAHAGRGLATRLLLTLLDGADADRVVLEVRPDNRRAQRLYGRFGFVPAGIHRNFYDRGDGRGSRDALVMVIDGTDDAFHQRLNQLHQQIEQEAA